MSARKIAFGIAGACAFAAGCGGGLVIHRFDVEWIDDGGKSMGALQQKLASVHPAPGADVVVGVTPDNGGLVGVPLTGEPRWTFAHPIDARPVVAGNVVVGTGDGKLFALDAKHGDKLWSRPTGGLHVHGAGDDGAVTVVTMSSGTGRGSVLLAVSREGQVMDQIETDRVLGTPAVLGGYAFVPWNNVFVSAIDLSSGYEKARLVVRDKTSRAWTEGGQLYFGEVAILRFDDRIRLADKHEGTHVSLPSRELAGSPTLMEPGTANPGALAQARDRIRIYARPSGADGEPLGIDSDRYYATYFKLVMGLTTKGALAWVHSQDTAEVIGGAAGEGSVVLCDDAGKVTVLDAKTGGVSETFDLGDKVNSCVVHVDGFHAASAPAEVPPLSAQISAALLNRDAELATAKRLLLRELTTLQDDSATKTLIDLASDERTPPMILDDARKALADRRTGAQYMIEALRRHYDFLKDELRPPPVGPMAQALAAMNAKEAAPLLAAHLLDPADTDDDVRRAADALVRLAGPDVAPQLTQFFAIYRSATTGDENELAVVSVAQALAQVGGADGKARVAAALKDGMTDASVRERIAVLVQK